MTMPILEATTLSEGVKAVTTEAYSIISKNQDLGRWMFNSWLEGELQDRSY